MNIFMQLIALAFALLLVGGVFAAPTMPEAANDSAADADATNLEERDLGVSRPSGPVSCLKSSHHDRKRRATDTFMVRNSGRPLKSASNPATMAVPTSSVSAMPSPTPMSVAVAPAVLVRGIPTPAARCPSLLPSALPKLSSVLATPAAVGARPPGMLDTMVNRFLLAALAVAVVVVVEAVVAARAAQTTPSPTLTCLLIRLRTTLASVGSSFLFRNAFSLHDSYISPS